MIETKDCDTDLFKGVPQEEKLGKRKSAVSIDTDDESATVPCFPSSSSESSLASLSESFISTDGNESILSETSSSKVNSILNTSPCIEMNHDVHKSTTNNEKISGTDRILNTVRRTNSLSIVAQESDSMNTHENITRETAFSRVRKRNRRYTPSPLQFDRIRGLGNNHPRKLRRRNYKRSNWLISSDNRFKIMWDVCTAILSICSFLDANRAIQTKSYEQSYFVLFCEVWFLVDICLNFLTEHKTINGDVTRDGKAVWARYLTTWFPIDVLSLIPWERIFVKPIVDMQKKRGFFRKSFFRTKAVIRVSRKLRGGHFKLFGRVANKSKHAGVGGRKLLTYIIKYVPKYVMFYKNMKGVLAVRLLRQIHWGLKVVKTWVSPKKCKSNPQDDRFDKMKKSRRYVSTLSQIKEIRPFQRKRHAVYSDRIEGKFANDMHKTPGMLVEKSKEDESDGEEDFGFGLY